MSFISQDQASTYTVFDNSHDVEITAQQGLQDIRDIHPEGPGRLAEYLAHHTRDLPEITRIGGDPSRPITFLIDCSGSMRGLPILALMASLFRIGDDLARQGRQFQVLGFTTKHWQGGEPYENWRDAGRPKNPGRLCPLMHITFKSFDDNWSDVRTDLSFAFKEGLMKENVDGEALIWSANKALDYAEASGLRPAIVYITDGHPHDDRTTSVNPEGLLYNHMVDVKSQIQNHLDMEILSLDTNNGKHRPHPEATFVEWNMNTTKPEHLITCMTDAAISCVEKVVAIR
jgi:cobaltochelatase CobT